MSAADRLETLAEQLVGAHSGNLSQAETSFSDQVAALADDEAGLLSQLFEPDRIRSKARVWFEGYVRARFGKPKYAPGQSRP